jgi:hypothetical protein
MVSCSTCSRASTGENVRFEEVVYRCKARSGADGPGEITDIAGHGRPRPLGAGNEEHERVEPGCSSWSSINRMGEDGAYFRAGQLDCLQGGAWVV